MPRVGQWAAGFSTDRVVGSRSTAWDHSCGEQTVAAAKSAAAAKYGRETDYDGSRARSLPDEGAAVATPSLLKFTPSPTYQMSSSSGQEQQPPSQQRQPHFYGTALAPPHWIRPPRYRQIPPVTPSGLRSVLPTASFASRCLLTGRWTVYP